MFRVNVWARTCVCVCMVASIPCTSMRRMPTQRPVWGKEKVEKGKRKSKRKKRKKRMSEGVENQCIFSVRWITGMGNARVERKRDKDRERERERRWNGIRGTRGGATRSWQTRLLARVFTLFYSSWGVRREAPLRILIVKRYRFVVTTRYFYTCRIHVVYTNVQRKREVWNERKKKRERSIEAGSTM